MTPTPEPCADPRLSELSENAAALGFEIVEISGFLDEVDRQSGRQAAAIADVTGSAQHLMAAGDRMREELDALARLSADMQQTVEGSVGQLQESSRRAQDIAGWVQGLAERMTEMGAALSSVLKSNAEIAAIASQVNILAINAKIEAARAGSAGRGFGVVAEAINELSARTAKAAGNISERVEGLSDQVGLLTTETSAVSGTADEVIAAATAADAAVGKIAAASEASLVHTGSLIDQQGRMAEALDRFGPTFRAIGDSAGATAQEVHAVNARVHSLIDRSEAMVQTSVALGGDSRDQRFIARVRADAEAVGAALEQAVARGLIGLAELFERRYREIPGSDPQQVMAPFTAVTDCLLPPIQEAALTMDPRVVFCAAVDQNGYLPTHNRKFSQPQSGDPVWNAANCRNRRIFNDRVGLKAGRNTAPFLLQVYRRDMGGGAFVMMKDLSAPIFVQGRHWGGLRLAYRMA